MTRILIVDDSASARKGLRDLVKGNTAWEVCGEAVDGHDAINWVRETSPDLVILDFQMPIMSGLQAAREIFKLLPRVRILLCTLHISLALVSEARRAGIHGTVSKTDSGRIIQGIEAPLRQETFYSWN